MKTNFFFFFLQNNVFEVENNFSSTTRIQMYPLEIITKVHAFEHSLLMQLSCNAISLSKRNWSLENVSVQEG